jgi:hypothetical protein
MVYVCLDLCMNVGRFQLSILRTLDRKTTQIWWLANMEYKHLKLWLLCVVVAMLLFDVSIPTTVHPFLSF